MTAQALRIEDFFNVNEEEHKRLSDLHELCILDSEEEKEYDAITKLATVIGQKPITLISFVDKERQWFKSKIGIELKETPREMAFCNFAIKQDELFLIQDTYENDQFKNHPLVTSGPYIRFYAGIPLKTYQNQRVGTLCLIDTKPGTLNNEQIEGLYLLGRQVVELLELRRANLKLKQIHEMRTRLLSVINHEMRTPLNIIMGHLDLISDDAETRQDDHTLESCQYAKVASEQLLNMISDSFDQIAIDTGKLRINLETIDLAQVVQECIQECKSLAANRNIEIVQKIKKNSLISADPVRVKQIITNLLSNAFKYADPNSKVHLVLDRKTAHYMNIKVSNYGPMIEANLAEKIFERYYRAPNVQKSAVSGFGLGLPIARDLARRQGGDLFLLSSVNGLTTFEYCLRG